MRRIYFTVLTALPDVTVPAYAVMADEPYDEAEMAQCVANAIARKNGLAVGVGSHVTEYTVDQGRKVPTYKCTLGRYSAASRSYGDLHQVRFQLDP